MKTFKQLIAEVAQPNNEDELNFKEKHYIEVIDYPSSKETQHSAEKKSPKRRADYDEDEDEEVYEANLDPVGQEDGDVDNDGDVDDSDSYLLNRRKVITRAMKKEATTSPYAIGMAAAMKSTGDEPPLKKSTIKKAHKIAKGIMKDKSGNLGEDAVLDQIRAILTKKNDGTKVVKDKSGYFHIKYNNSSHRGPYHTLEDVLRGLRESAFVAKAAAAYKDDKKKFSLDGEEFPVTIKKATADKIFGESAELLENEQMAAIGRELQKMAPKEKNDVISNAMANLGDHLESYGTPFGAKNMRELEKKTGLTAAVIQALIKKTGVVKESVGRIDEMRQPFVVYDTADGNKVVAMASDEQGAKRSIASAERPPMSVKDKSTLKIMKTRKKQYIGFPLKEETGLSENFEAGSIKLDDGSSVILKGRDAKLLNQMFADLNADNKKRMMKVAMTDKNGFDEILSFAREAL